MTYKTLNKGSSGNDVRELQNKLIAQGYNVGSTGADGIYGSNTEAAVRKYQQDNGLTADGIAGEQTLGKLNGTQQESQQTTQDTQSADTVPSYKYDPSSDAAYQQALTALQEAQKTVPNYQASYDQQLKDLYDQIVNRDKFSYNANEDPLYQMYRDMYNQQGQMAAMNTMGQAAGLTGGYGSSYSQAAGQQAYQAYLQQLNEVVPELYGIAQDNYNQQGEALLNHYAILGDMADTEYARYQDALNQYWQNLQFAKENESEAYNRGYGEKMDELAYQQWLKEFEEDKRRYDQEWELALQKRNGTGVPVAEEEPAYSEFGTTYEPIEHGMSEAEIKALQSAAGLEPTGVWDADTEGAYNALYGNNGYDVFRGWSADMWYSYFSSVRTQSGKADAEAEYNDLVRMGLIPKSMQESAKKGATGTK